MKHITSIDGIFECPNCGEHYFNQHPQYGKTVISACDGEDGCGAEFEVEYLDDETK
jgi:hypothetical protein